MIEIAVVTLAFGASLAYVWRYYQRRVRRGSAAEPSAAARGSQCPPGCSGCPRD